MVLTQGEDIDVFHNDQFIVILMENRSVDQIPNIFLVALGEVEHGLRVSLGGLAEPFSLWVFSNAFKDCPHSSSKLLDPFFGLFGCGF
jgi:hypothetical protein